MGGKREQLDGRCQSDEPEFDCILYVFNHRLLHTSARNGVSADTTAQQLVHPMSIEIQTIADNAILRPTQNSK
jgi:hypothetical protein